MNVGDRISTAAQRADAPVGTEMRFRDRNTSTVWRKQGDGTWLGARGGAYVGQVRESAHLNWRNGLDRWYAVTATPPPLVVDSVTLPAVGEFITRRDQAAAMPLGTVVEAGGSTRATKVEPDEEGRDWRTSRNTRPRNDWFSNSLSTSGFNRVISYPEPVVERITHMGVGVGEAPTTREWFSTAPVGTVVEYRDGTDRCTKQEGDLWVDAHGGTHDPGFFSLRHNHVVSYPEPEPDYGIRVGEYLRSREVAHALPVGTILRAGTSYNLTKVEPGSARYDWMRDDGIDGCNTGRLTVDRDHNRVTFIPTTAAPQQEGTTMTISTMEALNALPVGAQITVASPVGIGNWSRTSEGFRPLIGDPVSLTTEYFTGAVEAGAVTATTADATTATVPTPTFTVGQRITTLEERTALPVGAVVMHAGSGRRYTKAASNCWTYGPGGERSRTDGGAWSRTGDYRIDSLPAVAQPGQVPVVETAEGVFRVGDRVGNAEQRAAVPVGTVLQRPSGTSSSFHKVAPNQWRVNSEGVTRPDDTSGGGLGRPGCWNEDGNYHITVLPSVEPVAHASGFSVGDLIGANEQRASLPVGTVICHIRDEALTFRKIGPNSWADERRSVATHCRTDRREDGYWDRGPNYRVVTLPAQTVFSVGDRVSTPEQRAAVPVGTTITLYSSRGVVSGRFTKIEADLWRDIDTGANRTSIGDRHWSEDGDYRIEVLGANTATESFSVGTRGFSTEQRAAMAVGTTIQWVHNRNDIYVKTAENHWTQVQATGEMRDSSFDRTDDTTRWDSGEESYEVIAPIAVVAMNVATTLSTSGNATSSTMQVGVSEEQITERINSAVSEAVATALSQRNAEIERIFRDHWDGESFQPYELTALMEAMGLEPIRETETVTVDVSITGTTEVSYDDIERLIQSSRLGDVAESPTVEWTAETSFEIEVDEGSCACTEVGHGRVEQWLNENGFAYSSFDYETECGNH